MNLSSILLPPPLPNKFIAPAFTVRPYAHSRIQDPCYTDPACNTHRSL